MVVNNRRLLNRQYYGQTILIVLISSAIVVATVCLVIFKSIENTDFPIESGLNSAWRWECEKNSCQKKRITNDTEATALSLPACRLFCSDFGALWPKPTGNIIVGTLLIKVNAYSIDVVSNSSETAISNLVTAAAKEFKDDIIYPSIKSQISSGGTPLFVTLNIANTSVSKLSLDTDESYILSIKESDSGNMQAVITSPTFFGARNGLQTLSQLIIYDDLRSELQMPNNGYITDKPAFPHRGIVLDTSRNYISVDVIKRTLKAMGASKLNAFHWHITDTHSFPYVSKSRPQLSKIGAYSPSKVYSNDDIKDIVEYAKVRGVKVIPEFDAPAHVGEGWQDTGFVVCLNAQPWQTYCVEPPCGQFDPTKDGLYDAIEDIYGDMLEQFDSDVFHMGGDEVKFTCWEQTPSITNWMAQKGWNKTEADFVKLWNYFQTNALERLYKKAGREIPAIMWTSLLTTDEYLTSSLPKEKYIIQVWTTGTDNQINQLLENGYKIILSNYDALYMDCGFGGWVTDGNNWCSPYIGWQKIYENKPSRIAGKKNTMLLPC
ncbi:unnamed protein product [Psylliodes chrysocephalus]|uniref:Beta-hexosaminidase n=1 Tax=Psylliodes chrysocephalus TaxID=3402493 RepID=A0A9P0GGE2_9CUCU|nr:unnamed protein product [Psylliodes chrysocephala]